MNPDLAYREVDNAATLWCFCHAECKELRCCCRNTGAETAIATGDRPYRETFLNRIGSENTHDNYGEALI
jgi:hypothetical protein